MNSDRGKKLMRWKIEPRDVLVGIGILITTGLIVGILLEGFLSV